ncbi:MAG: HlyD family secretion protein [Nitrospira sp.]|nr:HlyD family secretion protein [Nitrospira sp.]
MKIPKLTKETTVAETQVALLDLRLQRQAGNLDDRAQGQVLAQSLEAKLTELDGSTEKQRQLVLKSPIDGIVAERADSLAPGRWINEKLPLAYLLNPQKAVVVGLVPVEDIRHLAVGQEARFIPNDLTRSAYQARITEIREWDEQDVSMPYVASIYGGDVPVRKDARGHLRAEQSVYRVELEVLDPLEMVDQTVAGHVHIASEPQSLLSRVWDRIVAVMIRESGF